MEQGQAREGRMTELPLVALVWNDANSPRSTEIIDLDDPTWVKKHHSPVKIVTVGWVAMDDAEGVSIVGEYIGDRSYRSHTFVPRSLVVSMKPIKNVRKRKVLTPPPQV